MELLTKLTEPQLVALQLAAQVAAEARRITTETDQRGGTWYVLRHGHGSTTRSQSYDSLAYLTSGRADAHGIRRSTLDALARRGLLEVVHPGRYGATYRLTALAERLLRLRRVQATLTAALADVDRDRQEAEAVSPELAAELDELVASILHDRTGA